MIGVGGSSADRELVAFAVSDGRRRVRTTTSCSAFLAGVLPDHMVPFALRLARRAPDHPARQDRPRRPRRARDLRRGHPARRGGAASRDRDRGRDRVRSWPSCSRSRSDEIGMDENFFLLGGHSMLGAQLIARLERLYGVEISLRYLFDHPTAAAIADEVEHRTADRRPGPMSGTELEQGPAAQPLPPPRSGGPGQPVPALPPAARGGPGALGPVSARLGRHPLRGRRRRCSAVLRAARTPAPEQLAALGMAELTPIAGADGAADAVPRSARAHAGCAGWRRRRSRPGGSRICASTSGRSPTDLVDGAGRRRAAWT